MRHQASCRAATSSSSRAPQRHVPVSGPFHLNASVLLLQSLSQRPRLPCPSPRGRPRAPSSSSSPTRRFLAGRGASATAAAWRARETCAAPGRRRAGQTPRPAIARAGRRAGSQGAKWGAVLLSRNTPCPVQLLPLGVRMCIWHAQGEGTSVCFQLGATHATGPSAARLQAQPLPRPRPSPSPCTRASSRRRRLPCPHLVQPRQAAVQKLGLPIQHVDRVPPPAGARDPAQQHALLRHVGGRGRVAVQHAQRAQCDVQAPPHGRPRGGVGRGGRAEAVPGEKDAAPCSALG